MPSHATFYSRMADIINMVLAGEQEQVFPSIRGVIGMPILRRNRTIVNLPGFDADTGYFLIGLPKMPPIPANPTEKMLNSAWPGSTTCSVSFH